MKRSIAINVLDKTTGDMRRCACDLSLLSDDLRGHVLRMPRPGEQRRSVESILRGTSSMPDAVVVSAYAAQGSDVIMRPACFDDLTIAERRALVDCDRDAQAMIAILEGDFSRFRRAMSAFEDIAVAALKAWDGGSVPIWLAYRRFGSERFRAEADVFAMRYCARIGEALFDDVESTPRMTSFLSEHPTAQRIADRFDGSRIVRESTGALHGRWGDERGRRIHWTVLKDGSCNAEILFGSRRLAFIEVDQGKIRLMPKRSEIDPFIIDLVDVFIEEAIGDDYGPLFRGAT